MAVFHKQNGILLRLVHIFKTNVLPFFFPQMYLLYKHLYVLCCFAVLPFSGSLNRPVLLTVYFKQKIFVRFNVSHHTWRNRNLCTGCRVSNFACVEPHTCIVCWCNWSDRMYFWESVYCVLKHVTEKFCALHLYNCKRYWSLKDQSVPHKNTTGERNKNRSDINTQLNRKRQRVLLLLADCNIR